MEKTMFSVRGNVCGDRIRLGRALHKPPLTQQQLAHKTQFLGLELTKTVVSRLERGERHCVDAELKVIALALGVTVDWLLEEYDPAAQK